MNQWGKGEMKERVGRKKTVPSLIIDGWPHQKRGEIKKCSGERGCKLKKSA